MTGAPLASAETLKEEHLMKPEKLFKHLNSATALVLFLALSAFASADKANGKKITFTTKSEKAKELVAQIVRGIESYQGGPPMLQLAQQIVEADPEFAFGHYLVGTMTPPPNNKAHTDKALELAKKASEGERLYIEAVMLTRAQNYAEAAKIFSDLEKQFPEERMIKMMLGQVYTNDGKLDKAQVALEKAIQIDGSTPRAYGFLANIHLLKGEYGKARELYTTALNKPVTGVAPFLPYNGIAYTYIYEGKHEEALKSLNKYLDAYNQTGGPQGFPAVFIWNAIGRVLLESGRAEESMKAYEKGYETVKASQIDELQKKIWYGRVIHGRGRALAKLGKHEEAWKEADSIKKMIEEGGEPGKQFWPSYHYIAGYLKLESKDYAKAIEHLKQTDLNDPFHKLLLARAYDQSGDKENAGKLYKEIVDSNQISIERALSFNEAKKKLKS
jgi:tetratricopeptide (TPR) repeat protein